jgi:hypothetical protein
VRHQVLLDEESIGKHNYVVPSIVTRLARHQIGVIINPQTGDEISMGEHTPRTNIERRRDGEASGSNINSTFSVSREEWTAARNAVVNNTCLQQHLPPCQCIGRHPQRLSRYSREEPFSVSQGAS